jgi:5-methylcytosine-specific restriction endonuclease McrA
MVAQIDGYMSKHRNSQSIEEVQDHFNKVIDWADSTFQDVFDEMRGLEWGRFFKQYGKNQYDSGKLSQRVRELHGDPFVRRKKGIWEYVLGGEKDPKLLEIRVFDDVTKAEAYAIQTSKAQAEGLSNCPLCSVGNSSNSKRIWKLSEMEADHVTPWSKEGKTDRSNCEVLCRTHNRIKSDN